MPSVVPHTALAHLPHPTRASFTRQWSIKSPPALTILDSSVTMRQCIIPAAPIFVFSDNRVDCLQSVNVGGRLLQAWLSRPSQLWPWQLAQAWASELHQAYPVALAQIRESSPWEWVTGALGCWQLLWHHHGVDGSEHYTTGKFLRTWPIILGQHSL